MSLPEPVVRPITSSVHMAVRDRIRQDILRADLPGGTHLHQADLARKYGVSITPVREALRDLEGQGLVDITTFSGAVVHSATLEELDEVYRIRAQLMPLAVPVSVARITDAQLSEAERLAEMMDQGEIESWVEHNRLFHHLLEGASGNTHLSTILRRLADVSALYVNLSVDWRLNGRVGTNAEHRQLVQAYRAGDADKALEITLLHISQTLEIARSLLGKEGGGHAADS